MRRTTWLAGACVLGGLLVMATMSGLRIYAQAAAATFSSANPRGVVINEVAWGGTAANSSDEWIELHNTTADTVSVQGWQLVDDDHLTIPLTGTIPPHGYYLIERTDDDAVSDILADWFGSFGTGGLSNTGEVLTLTDSVKNVVDTANADGDAWPAGSASPGCYSMERIYPTAPDTQANWCTNNAVTRSGRDANGDPINGTPKAQNSCYAVPGLNLAKEGPPLVTAGFSLTCRLLLGNTGNLTARDVVVTDALPAGSTFLTQTSPFAFREVGPGILRWEVGSLPTGTLRLITLTLRADATLSGTATNVATATDRAGRTETASWSAPVAPRVRLYALEPANYGKGGEAAALVNQAPHTISLAGWRLNDDQDAAGVSFPTTATIEPGQVLWLAQDGDGFYPVWGFDADWAAQAFTRSVPTLNGTWPTGFFADAGDAAYLLDSQGHLVDALAYGDGAASQGWTGAAVPYGSVQVLYRKLDQSSGLPVPDTDAPSDWAQDPDDPIDGRKVRYPGWDLEELFFPAEITTTARFTIAVAPEGALDLVSQTIASAQETLRIEAYTLKSVALYEAISDRIQAGVAVTVLLESGASGDLDAQEWIVERLHNPPASSVYFIGETTPRYRLQHAKFVLVDDRLALVSTDNFAESSMPSDLKNNGTMGHRGFLAVTDSPGVIARLATVFARDCDPLHHVDVAAYDGSFAPANPLPPPDWTTYSAPFVAPLVATATHVTLLHTPEHALRDEDSLLGLLNRAERGDQIAVMQTDEPFTWTTGIGLAGLNPRLQAIIGAARREAKVRVLLDSYYDAPLAARGNTATCLRLNSLAREEGLNLSCRLANVTGLGIHAKVFLVSAADERWVHLGSINGTESSSKHNREVALQFLSAEAYEGMLAVFDHDWQLSHGPMAYPIHLPLVMRDYVSPADHPLVSEVLINPGGDDASKEWIELHNPGPEVDISGWTLGDAVSTGDYGDGRYAFPNGAQLSHGQVIVVSACAADFSSAYGFNPDYEWTHCAPDVADLEPVSSWAGFGLALGNTDDEVLLLKPDSSPADSVAWGGVVRSGVVPFTDFTSAFPPGASLKRYPPATDRDDCSRDFYVSYTPSPRYVPSD